MISIDNVVIDIVLGYAYNVYVIAYMTINIKFWLLYTTASHYIQPSLSRLLVRHKKRAKITKFTHSTFKYDLLTFKMTPGGVENGAIELAVLKIPYMHPRSCL